YTGSSGIDYFNIRGRQYVKAIDLLNNAGIHRIAKAWYNANVMEFSRHNVLVQQHWGDPELELWTNSADEAGEFDITTERAGDKMLVRVFPAIDSALVCAYKKDEVFMRGYTRGGMVELNAVDNSISDITLTVTKHNYIPGQTTVDAADMVELKPWDKKNRAMAACMKIVRNNSDIIITFSHLNSPLKARLLTVSGKTVDTHFAGKGDAAWNITNIPSGMYLVKATVEGTTMTQKFMVRR
ncbi:MAG: T9SS type A sorting domain-containing protein, partial [Chitinivibrionales bacterium]|nr:T9SS type A sorting domain-containing protein [Chitinivibrionales bacterium]